MRNTWWKAAWAGLLSLAFPGLGQIYARAWPLGATLAPIGVALIAVFRAITIVAEPQPATFLVLVIFGSTVLLFCIGTAVDAAIRFRRRPPDKPRWFRSAWFAVLPLIAMNALLAEALPVGWHNYSIESVSMAPTLAIGDYVAVGRSTSVARGDVVVFPLPSDPKTDWVKRVIGLPGDTVQLRGGELLLNGAVVPRRQTDAPVIRYRNGAATIEYEEALPGAAPYRIAKMTSTGSANDTAVFQVPPGQMFVLGDNRDNSLDSRFPQVGFVPVASVIGKAGTIFWSADRALIGHAIR